MYAKAFLAALAGSAVVSAAHNETTTAHTKTKPVHTKTKVVTEYTTYCPEPTHVTMNNKTYTVTEACTLTITDCPCTVVQTHPDSPWVPEPTKRPPPVDTGKPMPPPETNKPMPPPETNKPMPPPETNKPMPPPNTGMPQPPAVTGGAEQKQAAYGLAVAGALAAMAL